MSRQRFIHPAIFTSEDFISLSPMARLLWIGLFTLADDHGRGYASAISLKASVFPADTITTDAVTALRAEIESRTMIQVYKADGKSYYSIHRWKTYQRPTWTKPSIIPDPPRLSAVQPECSMVDDEQPTYDPPVLVCQPIIDQPITNRSPIASVGRIGLDRVGSDRVGSGGEDQAPAPKPRSREKAAASSKPPKQPKLPKTEDPDNPGAGPRWVAFKDWAYSEWKGAGNAGPWGEADWSRLNAAYTGFLKDDPSGGVMVARQSWLNYLADTSDFYAGHYPKKWSSEPSRWIEPKKPPVNARTAQNNAAMKQYLEEIENGTRPLISD